MVIHQGVSVRIPLIDPPHWLNCLEFTREDDNIVINIVKTNELSYGVAQVSIDEFNNMADLLLTP